MAALGEVFAGAGPLRAGVAEVGDPLAVLRCCLSCCGAVG
jgi:hypothetical protein